MNIRKQITIGPSPALKNLRLEEITGRTGVITEDVFGRNGYRNGYMVMLDEAYQGEYLWFIPQESVSD